MKGDAERDRWLTEHEGQMCVCGHDAGWHWETVKLAARLAALERLYRLIADGTLTGLKCTHARCGCLIFTEATE